MQPPPGKADDRCTALNITAASNTAISESSGKHVAQLPLLKEFWNNNHILSKESNSRIDPNQVYIFFNTISQTNLTFQRFKTLSGKCGIKQVEEGTVKYYTASPISSLAKAWHAREMDYGYNLPASDNTTQCKISLVNMRGLITNTQNKSPLLKIKCHKEGNNLIAVTESHLYPKQHYDEEVTRYFPGYSIERSDRKVEESSKRKKSLDDQQENGNEPKKVSPKDILQSGGGCLLLASPGLTLLPIESVCNGVCELLICEVPQLNTAAIVVYNPCKPNFNLVKFKDIIDRIDVYLSENEKKGDKRLDINLMGDFNFPPHVVSWLKSDQGLFPDVKSGDIDSQKEACRLLVDLMDKFSLTQIVDKPTREKNILDLFLTDNPFAYSPCKIVSMKPISDHNLVSFNLTISAVEQSDPQSGKDIPEAATFNYFRADVEKVQQALLTTD